MGAAAAAGDVELTEAGEVCGAEGTDAVDGAARWVPAWVAADTEAGATESCRTANTALHTVQRARTPDWGTFTGSTRYTVAQLGQVTFIW
jgi:hypothetical protein